MTSNMIGIPNGVSMYELGNSVEAIIKQWQCKANPQPEVVDLDPQLLIMTQSEPISVDISNGQESAARADDDVDDDISNRQESTASSDDDVDYISRRSMQQP